MSLNIIFAKIQSIVSSVPFDIAISIIFAIIMISRFISTLRRGFISIFLGSIISNIASVALSAVITTYAITALAAMNNFTVKQYHIWIIALATFFIIRIPLQMLLNALPFGRKVFVLDFAFASIVMILEIVLFMAAFNYVCDYIYQSKNSDLCQWIVNSRYFPEHIRRYHERQEYQEPIEAPIKISSLFTLLSLVVYENQKKLSPTLSQYSLAARIAVSRALIKYTAHLNKIAQSKQPSTENLCISPVQLQLFFQIPDDSAAVLFADWEQYNGAPFVAYQEPTTASITKESGIRDFFA